MDSSSISGRVIPKSQKWHLMHPYLTVSIVRYGWKGGFGSPLTTVGQINLHLERAAAGIGLHVNARKTEYMCYNQTANITTLDGTSLRLVDKFTYLGSSVSSTKNDIDTRLTKAWTAIDRLSIIWKSDLPGSGCIDTAIWMHYMDAN